MSDVLRFAVLFDSAAETKRAARSLFGWTACGIAAILLAARFFEHKLWIALGVGLALPLVWSFLRNARFARGGGWARGIQLELDDRELRLWGRGYGTRVSLEDARLGRRFVICYLGRLGFYRQVRLVIASPRATIELAAATRPDERDREDFVTTEEQAVELEREELERLARVLEARIGSRGQPVQPTPNDPRSEPVAGLDPNADRP
ncbi:MAG: hypothetical protein IT379_12210 [Deltaproteobacteria bacterium]|nr:hypothetical protein [Deltaproteobacteria bacterium]